jgi:hypothetical protein
MRHLKRHKIFESVEIPALVYDKDTRSMIGIYKILEMDDDFITIENLQEVQEFSGRAPIIYMDNKHSGHRYRKTVKLPIDDIKILNKISDEYFELSIPYRIYKLNEKDLSIKKLDSDFRIKDR